jgi:Tfp pilus assembly ATPase PilU
LAVRRGTRVTVYEFLCQISIMNYSMPDLMQLMVSERADALHFYPGAAPVLEVKRLLHRLQGAKLTPAEVIELLQAVTHADEFSEFESKAMVSFCYQFGEARTFHVMAFREAEQTRLEIRRLDLEKPPT